MAGATLDQRSHQIKRNTFMSKQKDCHKWIGKEVIDLLYHDESYRDTHSISPLPQSGLLQPHTATI